MTDTRRTITEADAEKMADRIIQRRLSTDSGYLHAENAHDQAEREDEIATEVWADLEHDYEIES
jgi:hypothetical protein